jgi:hypothetical protein
MNEPNEENYDELEAVKSELKAQFEVNRRLAKALIEVCLELEQLKLKVAREH